MKNKRMTQLLAIAAASVLMTTSVPAAEKAPWDKDNKSGDRWEYTLEDIREAMNDPLRSDEMEKFLLKKGYIFSTATGMPELITKLDAAAAVIPGGSESTIPSVPEVTEESVPSAPAAPEESVPSAPAAPEESVPSAPATSEESVPSAPAAPEESVPSAPEAPEESVPSAPAASEESVPSAPAAPEESVPSAPEAPEESAPSASEAQGESAPSAPEAAEGAESSASDTSDESQAGEQPGDSAESDSKEESFDKSGFTFGVDLLNHDRTSEADSPVLTDENLATVPGIAGTSGEHLLLVDPAEKKDEDSTVPVTVADESLNGAPDGTSGGLNQAGPGSTEIIGSVDKPATAKPTVSSSGTSSSGTASSSAASDSKAIPAENAAPKTSDGGAAGIYGMLTAVAAAMAGVTLLSKKRFSEKKETQE